MKLSAPASTREWTIKKIVATCALVTSFFCRKYLHVLSKRCCAVFTLRMYKSSPFITRPRGTPCSREKNFAAEYNTERLLQISWDTRVHYCTPPPLPSFPLPKYIMLQKTYSVSFGYLFSELHSFMDAKVSLQISDLRFKREEKKKLRSFKILV